MSKGRRLVQIQGSAVRCATPNRMDGRGASSNGRGGLLARAHVSASRSASFLRDAEFLLAHAKRSACATPRGRGKRRSRRARLESLRGRTATGRIRSRSCRTPAAHLSPCLVPTFPRAGRSEECQPHLPRSRVPAPAVGRKNLFSTGKKPDSSPRDGSTQHLVLPTPSGPLPRRRAKAKAGCGPAPLAAAGGSSGSSSGCGLGGSRFSLGSVGPPPRAILRRLRGAASARRRSGSPTLGWTCGRSECVGCCWAP